MIIVVKCNDPGTPMNGRQIVSKGYVYGGSVTFACDTNYTIQGKRSIICKADKSWSGSVPQCLGEYNVVAKYIMINRLFHSNER